jgi:hypothetical protein
MHCHSKRATFRGYRSLSAFSQQIKRPGSSPDVPPIAQTVGGHLWSPLRQQLNLRRKHDSLHALPR